MRLIDADEVLARIENPYQKAEIARWLRDAPTIERKTGKWEHGEELGRDTIGDCVTAIFYNGWKCSACGCCVEEEREPLYKFCPNCGAEMRGE